MIFRNTKKGFTLIELLVVISIIGLLSSVVLASVGTARAKARDSATRQMVREYRSILELEILDKSIPNQLYISPFRGNGVGEVSSCSVGGTSIYASKAVEICNKLTEINTHPGLYDRILYVAAKTGQINTYRIISGLSTGLFFCMDSLGNVTDNFAYGSDGGGWGTKACF